jgi:hypothetical protein
MRSIGDRLLVLVWSSDIVIVVALHRLRKTVR